MSLTFTDIFCGAGGSSSGLTAAGFELRLAANHWARAIETHASNFPGPWLHAATATAALCATRTVSRRLTVVAVGCGGGRHRAPALAEALAARLTRAGWPTETTHLDIHRPVITCPRGHRGEED